MAELSTLARPYAKAAFEYAVSANKLSPWGDMFSALSAICLDDKVQQLLAAPSLSSQALTEAFVDICGDTLDQEAKNLVAALAKYKRLPLLPFINEQFQLLKAAKDQKIDVVIETAFSLDAAELEKFKQALATSLAREVEIDAHVDESLIGGAVIRAGDTVIDGSVRSKLSKLSDALSQ